MYFSLSKAGYPDTSASYTIPEGCYPVCPYRIRRATRAYRYDGKNICPEKALYLGRRITGVQCLLPDAARPLFYADRYAHCHETGRRTACIVGTTALDLAGSAGNGRLFVPAVFFRCQGYPDQPVPVHPAHVGRIYLLCSHAYDAGQHSAFRDIHNHVWEYHSNGTDTIALGVSCTACSSRHDQQLQQQAYTGT